MRKSESGSVHIVVISLLVVALIGAMGFIFWQNFMQPDISKKATNDTTVTNTKQSANEDESKTASTNQNEGYLVLDSWGVRFKPTGNAKISYEQKNGNYWFTTDTWKSLGGACNTNGGVFLERMSEKSTIRASAPIPLNGEQKIGDYYYYYQGPQAVCSDTNWDREEPEYKIVKDLMLTIEAKK